MVFCIEMICLFIENMLEENMDIVVIEKYICYLIIEKDKDDIIGMINMKEVFYD